MATTTAQISPDRLIKGLNLVPGFEASRWSKHGMDRIYLNRINGERWPSFLEVVGTEIRVGKYGCPVPLDELLKMAEDALTASEPATTESTPATHEAAAADPAVDLSAPIGEHLAPLAANIPAQLSELSDGQYYMDPELTGRQRWMVGKVSGTVKKDKAVLKFISENAAERYLQVARALMEGYKLAAKAESDLSRLAEAEAEYAEAIRYGEDFSMRKLDVIGKQVAASEKALAEWHRRNSCLF
jgi:hypothetical protein